MRISNVLRINQAASLPKQGKFVTVGDSTEYGSVKMARLSYEFSCKLPSSG
jgi:hypothetical protein